MSKAKRLMLMIITCVMILSAPQAANAMGNGAYVPPAITVAVLHASRDVTMEIILVPKKGTPITVYPERDRRGWETCFRLYRRGVFTIKSWFGNAYDFQDSVIILKDRGETYTFPVPYEQLKVDAFNDFLTLDMKDGTLSVGRPLSREIGLFLMHLGMYLLTEGIVFWLFGIRSKRSWLIFFIQTVISKGAFCFFVRDWLNVDPRAYIALAAASLFFIVLDIMIYIFTMEEESKNTISKVATVSNVAAGVMAYYMLRLLPM